MSILQLQDISLKLGGKPILDGLTMDVWAGHVHAVIGPNGAGKSTMASLIMGLSGYTHYTGELYFDGQSLRDVPVDARARMGISLAWQEPARFEGLKVRAFLQAAAKDKREARLREVLDQVGLHPDRYLDRAVDKTLSGGERKRVELASILAMEPRLVIMDEPDSGIDVAALERIFAALDVLRAQRATVLMITHSLAVLQQADHAFLLCHGRIHDKGDVEAISRYFEDKCLPCAVPQQLECEV
jgi:Fe-S cluster assembly ATP-binding protein